jgi:hypothetical protein
MAPFSPKQNCDVVNSPSPSDISLLWVNPILTSPYPRSLFLNLGAVVAVEVTETLLVSVVKEAQS